MSRLRLASLAATLVLSSTSCGDSLTGPEYTVTTVTVEPASPAIRLGATTQLVAKGTDANGTAVNVGASFTSSDQSVVTVSATGLARGLKMGTATITAKIGNAQKLVPVIVTAGYPSTLTKLAGDNQAGIADANVTVAPSVQVKDSVGNVVEGVPVTFAVASGNGSVTNAVVTTNASGTATIGSWRLGSVAGANTLTATVAGATGNVTTTFTATAAAATPSQLAVTTPPSGALTATPFTVQPVIELRSAGGSVVATATNPVTVAISAGGRLSGTTTVNAVAGVARFTNVAVLDPGTFTLTFSSPGLASTTSVVTVAQGPAIAVTGPTITGKRGSEEPEGLLIPVTNAGPGVVSGLSIVSVTYDDAEGGWLTASLTGTSTPAYLFLEARMGTLQGGTHTAKVTLSGANAAPVVVPVTFIVIGAPATTIAVTRQPAGARVDLPFTVQPVVELRDANGLRATEAQDEVTVRIRSGSGTLSGTTTVAAVKGVATFTNLQISAPGTYVLAFEATGLTPGVSNPFVVTASTGLQIVNPPSNSQSGAVFLGQPVVRMVDKAGAVVTNENTTITASVDGAGAVGGFLSGTIAVNTVNGVATFTDLAFTGPAGTYTMTFTAPGLPIATATFTIQ